MIDKIKEYYENNMSFEVAGRMTTHEDTDRGIGTDMFLEVSHKKGPGDTEFMFSVYAKPDSVDDMKLILLDCLQGLTPKLKCADKLEERISEEMLKGRVTFEDIGIKPMVSTKEKWYGERLDTCIELYSRRIDHGTGRDIYTNMQVDGICAAVEAWHNAYVTAIECDNPPFVTDKVRNSTLLTLHGNVYRILEVHDDHIIIGQMNTMNDYRRSRKHRIDAGTDMYGDCFFIERDCVLVHAEGIYFHGESVYQGDLVTFAKEYIVPELSQQYDRVYDPNVVMDLLLVECEIALIKPHLEKLDIDFDEIWISGWLL